jgi:hypothetical protein
VTNPAVAPVKAIAGRVEEKGVHTLSSLALLWIPLGAYAQLLGMPIAWLKVRRTRRWREREERGIDLLAALLRDPTGLTIAWGYATVLTAIALGGEPPLAYQAVIWGPPLLFVPAMAISVNLGDLPAGDAAPR